MASSPEWKDRCAQALRKNLPETTVLSNLKYRYTCPSNEGGAYLPQWLWDSCFHAMTYRWFDPEMAWEELLNLLTHQISVGNDKGMIPHMSHLAENRDRVSQELFHQKNASILTQPPLISTAFLSVYRKAPDRSRLSWVYPKLRLYHDWFDRRRDDDKDHLVALIHPWESGWDASQRWDSVMGCPGRDENDLRTLEGKRKNLVSLIREHDCDAEILSKTPGAFYVEASDFNAIRVADLSALAELAEELGYKDEAKEIRHQGALIREAIRQKMVTMKEGSIYFHDLIGREEIKSPIDHGGKFILLFGQCIDKNEAKILINQLVKIEQPYRTKYRIASTNPMDPTFNGDEYWRGNVWLSLNWLVFQGLLKYGEEKEAQHITEESLSLVKNQGFCEFFNPLTGMRGKKHGQPCPQNYGWSTIVLDMLMELEERGISIDT